MKIVDGTVVHYYLSFVVAYNATNSDNIYNYLIDLRGVTGKVGAMLRRGQVACSLKRLSLLAHLSVYWRICNHGFVCRRKQGFDYKPARLLSASKFDYNDHVA